MRRQELLTSWRRTKAGSDAPTFSGRSRLALVCKGGPCRRERRANLDITDEKVTSPSSPMCLSRCSGRDGRGHRQVVPGQVFTGLTRKTVQTASAGHLRSGCSFVPAEACLDALFPVEMKARNNRLCQRVSSGKHLVHSKTR